MAVEEKILTKIAYYYYKQELTQSEIAQDYTCPDKE